MRLISLLVLFWLSACSMQRVVESENTGLSNTVSARLQERSTVQFVDAPFVPKWRPKTVPNVFAAGLRRSVVIDVDRPLPARFLLALVEQETGVRGHGHADTSFLLHKRE